jgi:microcystin-dependent protein
MPYTISFTDEINKGSIVVEDREINTTDTSLQFPGKQSTAYGTAIGENFLHLLENFAANNPPDNPVEGQTWYDTTVGVDQLKVYDGTNWVAAGGLKRGDAVPDISNSVKGDLWVDTDNQQLYLNNGAAWILVGPEFSQGLATGARAEQILGTDNVQYTILRIDVENTPAIILTAKEFTPKVTIQGFTKLNPGFNLSTFAFDTGTLKYNGVAEAAEALVVSGEANPVDASNFLRGDATSTSTSPLRVKTNTGIAVGLNGQLSLEGSGERAVLKSTFVGASLDIKVKNEDGFSTVIRAKSDTSVGINKENPETSLDVNGVVQVSEQVKIDGTEDSDQTFDDNLTDGSFVTSGGGSVALGLKVGGTTILKGPLKVDGNITTRADEDEDATAPNISGFNQISATTFVGNLQGSVTGSIEGAASSASKLTNKTEFRMVGDVSSDSFTFDGAADEEGALIKTFRTTLSNEFIADKDTVVTPDNGDEILINRTVGDTGLFRITIANLLSEVPKNPVGMIVPFAGINIPEGWILCDGRIILKKDAFKLWEAIGHQFLDPSLIPSRLQGATSATHFALPDFRGRFPLGADNMGGIPADRVTNVNADVIGAVDGSETKDIFKENLPQHTHDMKSSGGQQFYGIIDTPDDDELGQEVEGLNIATGAATTAGLPVAGDIVGGGTDGNDNYREVESEDLGSALDIMPPFQTVNYIIFADNA